MTKQSIIGGSASETSTDLNIDAETAYKTNTDFWDTIGSDILGVTALPSYGGFNSEDKLHLLGDVTNKKILEIGCGNGHSLKYVSDMGANELWGIDISAEQVRRTQEFLRSDKIEANIICAPMESECGIPKEYFDIIYSVYAIGWSTDLKQTFRQIYSYLKKDGVFIFSWSHPIHKCVSIENDTLIFCNSYFDESRYSVSLENKNIVLSNRKLSTYINTLAENGFMIEKLVEETDEDSLKNVKDKDFCNKAKMLPVTFVIKARKI